MYVWRGKNRRDRRNFLSAGLLLWNTGNESKHNDREDEILRYELEQKHVDYFAKKVRLLILEYMNTVDGQREVELVVKELQAHNKKTYGNILPSEAHNNDQEKMRASVLEIFRQFAVVEHTPSSENAVDSSNEEPTSEPIHGSYSSQISMQGLHLLLGYIHVSMTEKEFRSYAKDLGLTEDNAIPFETFYQNFTEELDKRSKRSKRFLKLPILSGKKNLTESEETQEEFESFRVSLKMQVKLQENEARVIIADHAVAKATEAVQAEFRVAHPPKLICHQCGMAFPEYKQLVQHEKDNAFHVERLKKKIIEEEKFSFVEKIFESIDGRMIRANRLIFSVELGNMQTRVEAAAFAPFRPRLADPHGKRQAQLRRGMMVQGYDPKGGVRSTYRKFGMIRQHLQAARNTSSNSSPFFTVQPQLQDVINDLLRCKDDFIDTVSIFDQVQQLEIADAKTLPTGVSKDKKIIQNDLVKFAIVRFQWNGFAATSVSIMADFTSWKPEAMSVDPTSGKFFSIKKLPVGRYKYRYFIDGKECVDPLASQMVEEWRDEKNVVHYTHSNVVMVTSSPLNKQNLSFHVDSHLMEVHGLVEHAGLSDPALSERSQSDRESGLITDRSSATGAGVADVSNCTENNSIQQSVVGGNALNSVEIPFGTIFHMGKADKDNIIHRLENINLRNVALYDDGAWTLSSYMQKNSYIRSIDLSFNLISDEGIQTLAAACPKMLVLEVLKLNGNGFGYDGCRHLAMNLKKIKTLTTLELSDNRIGDDGAEALAEYLCYNSNLLSLYLDTALVGSDGMDALADALICNKTLTHLSLSANQITSLAMHHLCRALEMNAAITKLNISCNPFGPDGGKHLGQIIAKNDTLQWIDASSVSLLTGFNTAGVFSICYGLQRNRALKTLILKNNGLLERDAIDVANALMVNRCLTELDVSGNTIPSRWMLSDAYLPTPKVAHMPTLQTSLDKNKKDEEHLAYKHRYDPEREIDDDECGRWNRFRRWKRIQNSPEKKHRRRKALEIQEELIRKEMEYVTKESKAFMNRMKHYLTEQPCRSYLKAVSKAVSQYLHELASYDEEVIRKKLLVAYPLSSKEKANIKIQQELFLEQQHRGLHPEKELGNGNFVQNLGSVENELERYNSPLKWKEGKQNIDEFSVPSELNQLGRRMRSNPSAFAHSKPSKREKRRSSATRERILSSPDGNPFNGSQGFVGFHNTGSIPKNNLLNAVHSRDQTPIKTPMEHSKSAPIKTTIIEKEASENYNLETRSNLEAFMNAHMSILHSIFININGKNSHWMVHPEKIQQVMHMLALLIPESEIQAVVDETLLPVVYQIGFSKLSHYILANAKPLSKKNKFYRMRVLADLLFNPPEVEAKTIILDNLYHVAVEQIRKDYRSIPEHVPHHICHYCDRRFSTRKALHKHVKNGYNSTDHRLHRLKEKIYRCQVLFLREIKRSLIGVYFPAYFETVPIEKMPYRHYSPQVMDKIGSGGRPIGVVDEKRTVRALDVFGEYLSISFNGGEQGWVRYRIGSQPILQPACSNVPGFDWSKLHIQETITYYRVSDSLPENVELKVRHQPLLSGEVCGHLKKGQVVECFAVIGDWLQIRFENEDSAWVLWRKEGSGRKQYETDIVDFVPAGNLSSDHTDSMATMHHVPSSVFNRQDQPSTSTEVTIFDNAEEELEQDNIWLRKFRKQYNRYDISKNVFYKINDLCGVNTKGGPLKATSKKQDLFLILLPDDVYRQLAECVDPSPIKHQKAATQSYRNMESKLNSALASKRVISPFSVTEEQLLQSVLNIDRELQLGNNPLANSVNALGKETPPIFGIKVVAPMYYQKENTEGDDDDKSYDSLYQYGPSRYHDEEEAVQHLHGLLPFGLAGYVDNRAYEEEDVDEEDSGADEDDRKFDEETLQLEDMF